MNDKEISEIINELGEQREQYFNSVAPPIIQTSNFSFKTVNDLRNAFEDESKNFIYSRAKNPTLNILSEKLAALDGAEDCLVVNSGAGAIFISVLANVKSGDHIISVAQPYSWTQKMFDTVFPRFNISVSYVDGRDANNFKDAIRDNTTLIYLESPNSWSFAIQDLHSIATLAKSKNIITVCDNSYCTPLYQQPIALGIDISVQSATKYICGHSDVVAGVICGSNEMISKIFKSEYMNLGIGTTPFNAWLLLRGLRTLSVRMDRVSANTKKIIEFLKNNEQVEKILYPLMPEFDQYELAKKQMKDAGGLFSFIIKAQSALEIENFCNSLRHILMAVSWGGYESLIIPGIASIPAAAFDASNEDHRRIRIYIGLEDADYIIDDLNRGFNSMKI
ncbi:MAG: PLP-dependent transferase [Bacteroidetes bacterium]|nr:PLP-dependent transferase [Bacteroidota bacterium]